MANPLDLRRLATRIEQLMQVRTHGWHPADELDFRNRLPTGRIMDKRRRLPDPADLRAWADEMAVGDRSRLSEIVRMWRPWIQTALDLEGLIRDNDPRNPRRMIRDVQRGKFPRRFARSAGLGSVSDDAWDTLMKHAERQAGAKKKKVAAMLYEIVKLALDEPEHREVVMPLIRLAREGRVAAESFDIRSAVIRAAYEASSPTARVALVRAVTAADERVATASVESAVPDDDVVMTWGEYARLVRVAYTTTSGDRKHQILGILKEAKYSPGFLKWVENQVFHHPETGNKVKFVSLPPKEQQKIHAQWKQGKKEWAQKFKPEGLSEETLLTPEKVDMLTVVLIGSSETRRIGRGDGGAWVYTPRGYASKAEKNSEDAA